jgi:glutathione peroxidase
MPSHSHSKAGNPVSPIRSVYNVPVMAIDGAWTDLSVFRGKRILIVNTASECGFTPQYAELQKLHEQYSDRIAVIAFPCNQFGAQEPGDNSAVLKFCQVKYGVTFPVYAKCDVMGPEAAELYRWLTDPSQNGWNDHAPTWNFCKYIIDENGRLEAAFGPSVSPFDKEIIG